VTKDEIRETLQAATEEMQKRAQVASWEPSETGPLILVVEEFHSAAEDAELQQKLAALPSGR
jgi:hypothetical protein